MSSDPADELTRLTEEMGLYEDPYHRASERAMQMICATIHNGQPMIVQARDVERIVNAWVHHPEKLTPTAMKEDLPRPT